jgi:hypothetical protein
MSWTTGRPYQACTAKPDEADIKADIGVAATIEMPLPNRRVALLGYSRLLRVA